MRFKISDTNICIFFMTLLVFLDMEPFFTWSSVSSLGYQLYTGIILVTTIFMSYLVLFRKRLVARSIPAITDRKSITFPLLLVSTIIVLLFFYEVYFSGVVTTTRQPFNMAMLCIHLGLMMFTLQDNLTLRSVYLASKKIFAVSLIPALIVFVLMQIGISLPHITLAADVGKDMTGQSYQLYAGLATMLRNNGGLLNRLCGMYREPGFVGTIGALFLLGDKISLRKWENVIILAASLCTFSLAFVVMLLLGVMLRAVGNMRKRRNMVAGVAVVFAVIVGYFVFMSLPLDSNSALGELQGRLVITEDGGLAGDNRFGSSEWAEEAYDAFLNSSLKIRLFGYGADYRAVPGTDYSIWQSVCSYKEFVFSFGFLGLIILGIGFILSVFVKYRGVRGGQKWNIFVLLTIFLVSIYQRFDVANFHYFCVLFGGASNLALMGVETEKDASSDSKSGSRRIVFRWASAEKERF